MKKKVLIISYTFPPYPGIGGRRWAKFAKYFQRNNIEVHVLAAKNPFDKISNWLNDIAEIDKSNISYFTSNYPKYLWGNPVSVFQKIAYRISLLYAKIATKGNYYDRSAYCKSELQKLTREKINEGYNNVIISGGPFDYMTHLLPLKSKYPNVNFIADFRDPWVANRTNFGFESLSKNRQQYEIELEKKVAVGYDKIITVAEPITDYYSGLCCNASKCHTVHNGFDKDDFKKIKLPKKSDKLSFILAGTLYLKSEKYFNDFLEGLLTLKKENKEVYNALEFNFMGNVNNRFIAKSKQVGADIVNFRKRVPLDDVYEKINKNHFAMLFLTEDIDYSFSTKFCEYIGLKKPILVFGGHSKTGEYVEKNKIGYDMSRGDINQRLLKLYSDYMESGAGFNPNFNTAIFDVEHLATKYAKMLI